MARVKCGHYFLIVRLLVNHQKHRYYHAVHELRFVLYKVFAHAGHSETENILNQLDHKIVSVKSGTGFEFNLKSWSGPGRYRDFIKISIIPDPGSPWPGPR